jgi:hypothetical protein
VEHVLRDQPTGEISGVLVRHGRADYLLRIPVSYLLLDLAHRLQLDDSLELDEMERSAIESGRTPPVGEHLTYGGHTQPTPSPEEVLAPDTGVFGSYDGPSTG